MLAALALRPAVDSQTLASATENRLDSSPICSARVSRRPSKSVGGTNGVRPRSGISPALEERGSAYSLRCLGTPRAGVMPGQAHWLHRPGAHRGRHPGRTHCSRFLGALSVVLSKSGSACYGVTSTRSSQSMADTGAHDGAAATRPAHRQRSTPWVPYESRVVSRKL